MSYGAPWRRLNRAAWLMLGASLATCFIFAIVWADLEQPPTQQHPQQRCTEQPSSNASLKSGPIQQPQANKDCDARAEAKKSALEFMLERANSFFDFKITDFLLVIFTWILAVKTAGLFTETAALRKGADDQRTDMMQSIAAAKKSADAAMLAVGSERAWITFENVEISHSNNGSLSGVAHKYALIFSIRWKNLGRSPAVKVEIYHDHKIVRINDVAIPQFTAQWQASPNSAPIGPGIGFIGNYATAPYIADDDREAFMRRETAIIVYGAVKYYDVFANIIRMSEACCRLAYSGERATTDGKRAPMWDTTIIGTQNTVT